MPQSVNSFSPPPNTHWPEPERDGPSAYRPAGRTPGFYPLTIGRTVTLAWNLFRFGWRTFVAINLIVAIPVVLISTTLTVLTFDQMSRWQELLLTGDTNSLGLSANAADLVASFPWNEALATFVLGILLGFVSVIGTAALTHAIGNALTGVRLSVRASYRYAFSRLRDVLSVYVLLTLAGLALAILVVVAPLLIVDGPNLLGGGGIVSFVALLAIVGIVFVTVFLVIRFIFTIQVLVFEGQHALPSLRRSYALVAGSMLRVIGYAIVFGLILGLIGLVVSFVAAIVSLFIAPPTVGSLSAPAFNPAATFVQTLITNLLAEVFSPILAIGFVLLYFDTRFRHGEKVPGPGGELYGAETAS